MEIQGGMTLVQNHCPTLILSLESLKIFLLFGETLYPQKTSFIHVVTCKTDSHQFYKSCNHKKPQESNM